MSDTAVQNSDHEKIMWQLLLWKNSHKLQPQMQTLEQSVWLYASRHRWPRSVVSLGHTVTLLFFPACQVRFCFFPTFVTCHLLSSDKSIYREKGQVGVWAHYRTLWTIWLFAVMFFFHTISSLFAHKPEEKHEHLGWGETVCYIHLLGLFQR